MFHHDCSRLNTLAREFLCALLFSSLQRSLLDRIIRRLVRPELEVFRAISRLADLPRHPWHAQTIEYSDVICQHLRFVVATCAKFFEKRQLVGGLGMFQGNGAFRPEFFDTAVGVKGHEIERFASPVLWDVGVRELVASSCWVGGVSLRCVLSIAWPGLWKYSPVDTSTLLSPMSLRMNLDRSHHQFGTGAMLLSRWPWPSFWMLKENI